MKQLYLECSSGISGDMCVAALLDLGADCNVLRQVLQTLPLSGFQVQIDRVNKMGISACDFDVLLDKCYENHDHDMDFLYGHLQGDTRQEPHHHDAGDAGHHHAHGAHHAHRGLKDVISIIEQTQMTPGAKQLAKKIFMILAQAEARAHGTTPEAVHFHEVGAIDSIVDIIAFAVCFDNLAVTDVIIPRLCEGNGTIRCQHGILPVPVPAVTEIACEYGLKLHMTNRQGELVTPTGAAIAAAVKTSDRLPDNFQIIKTGMGAGKRDYEGANMVRAMLIAADEAVSAQDLIYKLETNIDDCTGEALGYVMERLMAAGALDVHYTPVYMKKNRPAYQLNVICDKEHIDQLEQIIFCETTTIGIRKIAMERSVLPRTITNVDTELGRARTKTVRITNEAGETIIRHYPEYDSVAALAQKTGLSFQEVYRIVAAYEKPDT